jgi:signal transduction histidine kinase
VAHNPNRRFDAEDARRLQSVSHFASAAHQIALALKDRDRADGALGQTRFELRALSRHLIMAQEDERRRIARELHDDAAQRTALIQFAIEHLRDRLRVHGTTELCSDIEVNRPNQ